MPAVRSQPILLSGLITCCAILLSGCHNMNHTQAGALVGTGLGAITGAAIGSASGHSEGGAVIGALTGAVIGSSVGASEDAQEQRDAVAQARYEEQTRQAVTNSDLVLMTRNGLSDEVILSTIRAKGGRFDLSPSAVIALKNNGVSDAVIMGAQEYNREPKPREVMVIREEVMPGPDVSFGVMVGPRPVCRPRSRVHWGYHMHSW